MADDSELAAIRARRLAEMQAAGAGAGGAMGGAAGMQKQQQRQQEQEEMRQGILARILTPEARERLSRVGLVRAAHARQVEDMLIRAAQMGQITEKVDEKKIISLLEQLVEHQPSSKITIQRRKGVLDSDED